MRVPAFPEVVTLGPTKPIGCDAEAAVASGLAAAEWYHTDFRGSAMKELMRRDDGGAPRHR